MIETPLAILNLKEIGHAAAASELPLTCFVLGTNDLIKATRKRRRPTGCRFSPGFR